MALAYEDKTSTSQTNSIKNNAFLSGLAFKYSSGFSIWSTFNLTYDLNVGQKPPGEKAGTWSSGLQDAIHLAIADVSSVCKATFTEVDGSADVEFWSYSANDDYLGYSWAITDAANRGVYVNSKSADSGLEFAYGSYDYITVIHEFLHNMGLAHPHDSYAKFPGVKGSGTLGDYKLNQNVYTVMSYNDAAGLKTASGVETTGWTPDSYGYGVLGAFDIAMLQKLYGANKTYNTGNDTYYLPKSDKAGTFYKAIWDAGGTDTFQFNGSQDAVIDLRPATLKLADKERAGGALSSADGVHGGFTIAKGTIIENATGGSGDDSLIGNGSANKLLGRGGADDLTGRNGKDILVGGNGMDTLRGGADADVLKGQKGDDQLFGNGGPDKFVFSNNGSTDVVHDFADGSDRLKLIGFGFVDEDDALQHFDAMGANGVEFLFQGTVIEVYGVDKAHLDATDLIV
ncbi:MAG: M10 family metallopeptidase C-terminal domain-containing protein [Hyphomicrobiaceae bacterium]|nr:M10 family metallopeptidase C-terminal domain-containing protein [Hyphomicrobiaceae bacterium]MCC0024219.1 M10 family metallopeptidase C-terminal domain-containing protein [Hyphomicrobiaceae bacterium]